jgi:hypothetical protein
MSTANVPNRHRRGAPAALGFSPQQIANLQQPERGKLVSRRAKSMAEFVSYALHEAARETGIGVFPNLF